MAVDCAEIMVWLLSLIDKFVLTCRVIAALVTSVISLSSHLVMAGC